MFEKLFLDQAAGDGLQPKAPLNAARAPATRYGGNLVEVLRCRSHNQPDRIAYTFLRDGEAAEVQLTYRELDRQAAHIAGRLLARLNPGERVLLVYEAGLDFIAAFFGCLYAGMLAVPAYPPRPNQSTGFLEAIAADCRAALGLTT